MRLFRLFLLGLACVATGLVAEWQRSRWSGPAQWLPDLAVGWTFIASGLVTGMRRPESRSGGLLTATGFAWFVPNFASAGPAFVGQAAAYALFLHRGPLVHVLLAYPTGRTSSRLTRGAVVTGYAVAILYPIWRNEVAAIVLATLLPALSVHQYVRAVGRYRRAQRVALSAATALGSLLAAQAVLRLVSSPPGTRSGTLLLAYEVTLCAIAVALAVGLLSAWWERAAVTDLVVELGETRSGTLRDELARALGDPSLQVGYWLPESAGFVDSEGRPLRIPEPGSARSTTMVERDGQAVAVLVHDPTVLADRGLREAVSAAAKLGAANARLQAEVRAQLPEIGASRRRLLETADEERGRLERRLREGAQRRLDRLAKTLHEAQASATRARTMERIAQAETQLARTQEELRQLARGIHPRDLAERGLARTLASLAQDFPLPVDLETSTPRLPQDVESCIYFVCSEALANVAKYADASRVRICVRPGPSRVRVVVEDDGVGGAEPHRGTGLQGLADRVETLGGTLTVYSRVGLGTRLVAVIPLGAGAA
jgi:signal transduction histidine kinase